jgi:predicted outer membrane repeat protein
MRSSGAACSWLAYLTLFLLLPASSSAPAGPDNSTAASSIYCTGLLGDGASATSGRSLIFVVQTPLDASDLAQAAACDGVYINVTWAAPVIIPTTIELGYGTTVSVRGELPAGMLPPPAVDGAGMRGLFRVGQQAILELYDIQLWNGAVDGNGGCIHARKGASVVCGKGCKMLGCVSGHRGGAVFLDSGSTLLMEDDASIMHNFSDKDGAGVAANAGSSITMSGTATVSSNECPGGGAGIWLEGECTLTMADRSSISNNTIPLTETEGWGAGIYASQFTRILMANHTSISDNFVGGNGGGAFLQYNTSLSMEGYAQLARNYATRGGLGGGAIGGVLSATVAMKDDSALIDNNAFGDNGGALYCWGNCSITMDDRARVEGNRAHNVGGFFLDLGSHLIMRGNSSISDNYPGGVMAYNECFISISGNAFVSRNMRATSGGAINAWSGTRMVLSGSAQITGNWALFSGGGLSVTRGSLNITGNVVIANNSADFRGGGICGSLSEIFLNDDAVIADNLSGLGGGVSLHLGRLRVSGRGSVRRNSAFGSGGGMYVTAGTIILADDAAIEDNSAGKSGAGVFMSGTSQINISNRTRIKRNSASADGGGLSVIASDANIEGDAVEISDNSAGRTGGGIALTLSSLLVKGRSVISGNTATGSGGAIYIRNSLAELQGDIAISSNEADVGGGVFVDHDGNLRLEGSVALVSNFARKGGGAIFAAAGAVLNAEDGTLFSLNEASRAGAGILFDSQAVPAGTIQISAKSVFVDNLSGCCAPQPLGTFPAALLGNENAGCSDLDSLDDVTDRVQGKYECCGLGEYSHPLTQECTKCQEGVDGIDCNALASKMGAQVESLPLARGFWRATPRSLDIVECEISGETGRYKFMGLFKKLLAHNSLPSSCSLPSCLCGGRGVRGCR